MHSNKQTMKTKIAMLLLILPIVLSCSSTKDITQNPASHTDFIVGKEYQLRKGALVFTDKLMPLGTLGSPTTLEAARKNLPKQIDALIEPDTVLVIRKVVLSHNPQVGTITDVFAEVISGSSKGRLVNVRTISGDDWSRGFTKRDPTTLEAR